MAQLNKVFNMERDYAGESDDELELLELLLLTLNLSLSLVARFIVRSLGENLLNNIFSMPWIGDSNMRQSTIAAANVRMT